MAGGAVRLTPELLLRAYASGIFPMGEGRDSPRIDWIDPVMRGIMPLDGLRLSRSLRASIRRGDYEIRINHDFPGTVLNCAAREETWINNRIISLYAALHRAGHAHSVEVWDGEMIGGLYGVSLGGAFFGESMFSRRTDASKIALAWQVHRLRAGGFTLLDTQFLTPHLQSLGGIEVPRAEYHGMLARALEVRADFLPEAYAPDAMSVSQQRS
ncbi:leucyl/phenylalanyl-tRNA--protein transferase [Cereibacter sp. SYSU M97828]|nr:leucyl/phenylalanyl-tRNA--protein transferase [Cereibacter flavus]